MTTLDDALNHLGPGAWQLFTDDYGRLCEGCDHRPDEVLRRTRHVAQALDYTGDPMAPVWHAAATHVETLVRFSLMTQTIDDDGG